LIVGNSTEDALILFNKVKANPLYEMKQREKQNALECRLINEFDRKESKPCDPPYLGTDDNYSHSFTENDSLDYLIRYKLPDASLK